MEKIYLGVIIAYVLMKAVPSIWRVSKLLNMLGYKHVSISGIPFVIRKLSPLDFVEEKNGLPLTFFNLAKGNTIWDQMQGENTENKLTEKEIIERVEAARMICEKAVRYWPGKLNASDFFNARIDARVAKISWKLYSIVISHNFPTFKKCHDMKREYVIHIAELCAKFGKKPHEHLKNSGNMSDLETYIIDEFFFTQLLIKENAQIEKQNNAIKKRNKR
jgi:hypothetical protein